MQTAMPQATIPYVLVFDALVISLLVLLTLKAVAYRPTAADPAIYGLVELAAPVVGIKAIDLLVGGPRLA